MAELTDQQIRNQILIEGVKTQEHLRFESYLRQIDRLVRIRLGDEGEFIGSKSLLNQLLSDIKSGQLDIYDEYNAELLSSIEALALDQADFGSQSLNVLLGDVTTPQVDSVVLGAIRNSPMQIQDYNGTPLLNPFIDDLTDNQVGMIQTRIMQGYAQGRTTDQITRDIRGTRASSFRDGDLARVNRSNRALVFTTLQHASTQARMSTYKKNKDVLTGYEWVSTLDDRTTTICRSLDGNEYKFDKGPLPPIHIACRSVTVPIVDKRYNLLASLESDRPSVGDKGAKQVGANTTYYGWLKTQPASFQDIAIGPARAKLLRDGGLTSEEFARLNISKSFQPLTLAEMKAKRPEVFERVNL